MMDERVLRRALAKARRLISAGRTVAYWPMEDIRELRSLFGCARDGDTIVAGIKFLPAGENVA